MDHQSQVEQILSDLDAVAQRIQTRMGELENQYPDVYPEILLKVEPSLNSYQTWVEQANTWLGERKRKRGNADQLLDEGEAQKQSLVSVEEYVVVILKAPRTAMSAVAVAASQVSLVEQRVPHMESKGGDTTELRRLMFEIHEGGRAVASLIDEGEVFQALQLSEQLSTYNEEIAIQLRSVELWIESLPSDVAAAQETAKSVDALASQAVKSTQSGCPADPKTLEVIKSSSVRFNQAMDILDQFKTGVPPKATTLIYQASEALGESKAALREVLELEATRNYAYTSTIASNREVVETLTSSALATADMWELLDEVSHLLTNGDVFGAVTKQAELVDLMESRLRPALSAHAHEQPAAQVVEAEAEFAAAAQVLAQEPQASAKTADLAALRELVKNLAGGIHAMREES